LTRWTLPLLWWRLQYTLWSYYYDFKRKHMRRGRVSLKDHMRAGLALQRAYAAAVPDDDPRRAANQERLDRLSASIAPKRHRVRRPVDGKPVVPLEKEIQTASLDALALRRDVVFVGRFNRGQAVATDDYGKTRYTPFNTVKGFPDIHGLLVGGRAFYIEVKRPPPLYKAPDSDQQKFLDEAQAGGACVGVAYSVEQALAVLPST
jgi:hypothetical protein